MTAVPDATASASTAAVSPEDWDLIVYPSHTGTPADSAAGPGDRAVRAADWCIRTWLPALLLQLAMSRPAQQLASQPAPTSWSDVAALGLRVHALDQRWAQLAPRLTALSQGLRCTGACARLRMVRAPAAAAALQELASYLPAAGVLSAPVHHRGQHRHTAAAADRALAKWETQQGLRTGGTVGAAHALTVTIALGDELAHTATVLAAGSADRLEAVWHDLRTDLDRQLPDLHPGAGARGEAGRVFGGQP